MESKKVYNIKEAQIKMENYCAYQERCHQEVTKKLREMQLIPEVIEKIMLHLFEHNFLNETRFAKAFASGKFSIKKWGKRRIVNELKRRNISTYNINQALLEIEDKGYYAAFDALAEKRLCQIKETNKFKKRKKLADYLLYRGWESEMVYDKVSKLIP
ncbi:MAG: recombinase RecX [Flavobacteriaceae bacterium CG2_30_34_30]|nr:RecX family transcriptional regulator [Flavobacteriia bacterium]OIP51323.1 MAG: recombinase RecX [Flavobacteriaceae bacterium CG2_30_34_30]PIQ17859.1 MAG: recombinase RecX [Flavobacteriaceae bacterium CG18_big_fil_WC_8_21_14_2_50_34_36]PIV51262.1 MAG: recombinase RecX [Flavobacteriaceae bacterium CG02_land_8_20_14_3_00_34_13]PIZ07492.1 MAG: recombinase RecX [Flavobacteriaceae bacterium CG_4_10_14_0_8_um_filter_34_31]PJC07279.1 MAG: recombinase RecX [Flavobacteriaceae bacterium CG_4_9_14_0_8